MKLKDLNNIELYIQLNPPISNLIYKMNFIFFSLMSRIKYADTTVHHSTYLNDVMLFPHLDTALHTDTGRKITHLHVLVLRTLWARSKHGGTK
jgi:hypothetical protein